MIEETTYAFIERRERELVNRETALRAELDVIGSELAHIRSLKNQTVGDAPARVVAGLDLARTDQIANESSIKQLVLCALRAGFREEGATSAQLRQFISDAYGRTVPASSMSPQLHRLSGNQLIEKNGNGGWRLAERSR